MGHSKISVTIPDELHNEIRALASGENIKLSHLVTEALSEKLKRMKEDAYIQRINKVFEDPDVENEQKRLAELIADHTDMEEMSW